MSRARPDPLPAPRASRSKPDWVQALGKPSVQQAACVVWFVTVTAALILMWRGDPSGLRPAISPLVDGLVAFVSLGIAGALSIVLSTPYQAAGEAVPWLGRLLMARWEWAGDYGPSSSRFIGAGTIALGVGYLTLTLSHHDLAAVAIAAVVGIGVWVWTWVALSEWDED